MTKKQLKVLKEALRLENKTIAQFEEVSNIMQQKAIRDTDAINKIIQVLEYLEVDEDIIDSLDFEGIAEVGRYFAKEQLDIDTKNVKNIIELNGRRYVCEPYDSFKLKGRNIGIIFERLGQKDIASFILAVIFKDDQLTNIEHRDINHIKHKQTLFKDLLVKDYYAYIAKVIHDVVITNSKIVENRIEDGKNIELE